jgi:phage-related protein
MGDPVVDVVVEALDEHFTLSEFTLDKIPQRLWYWELGGITDPIGQLFGWLWSNIQSSFTGLWTNILSSWNNVVVAGTAVVNTLKSDLITSLDSIGSALGQIPSLFDSLGTTISSSLLPVTNAITNAGSSIAGLASGLSNYISTSFTGLVNNISTALERTASSIASSVQGMGATLIADIKSGWTSLSSTLSSAFDSLKSVLGNAISSVVTSLQNFGTFIATQVSGVVQGITSLGSMLWGNILNFWNWVQGGVGTLLTTVSNLGTGLWSFLNTIPSYFTNLNSWVQGGIKDAQAAISNSVKGMWDDASGWFKNTYNELSLGVGEVKIALSGFVNPMIDISRGSTPFFTANTNYLAIASKAYVLRSHSPEQYYHSQMDMWVPPEQLNYKTSSVVPQFPDVLSGVANTIAGGAKTLWGGITSAIQGMIGGMVGGFGSLITWAQGLVEPHSPSIVDDIWTALASAVFTPLIGIPTALLTTLTENKDKAVASPTTVAENVIKGLVRSMIGGYTMSNILMTLGSTISTKLAFTPFGMGAEVGLKPALILKHLGKIFYRVPDVMIGAIAYGMGNIYMQPLMKYMASGMRNALPVEMPTLTEIRDLANRASVIEGFEDTFSELQQFMYYYGYSDWTVNWNLGHSAIGDEEFSTTIKDRFSRTLTVPLTLRSALPSPTDMARMMIHDLFLSFDQFEKAMKIHGFNPDWASLYYLLHYRYPTMDNLWSFITRAAAGFSWVDTEPITEAGMGLAGLSPKALSNSVSANPVTGVTKLMDFLLPYAKWHDYAPFAYVQGFTSDRLVMLDLMANIPTANDARSMYELALIKDTDLQRYIVASGMHPELVPTVTVAEVMRAISGERTLARTGVSNLFESGFITSTSFDSMLNNMASIDVMGKSVSVQFIKGEITLVYLKGRMERANNVLTTFWRNISISYSQNIMQSKDWSDTMSKIATGLKPSLGLNVEVDSSFLTIWASAYDISRQTETVRRLRYWLRSLFFRATQLSRMGIDITTLVDEFAKVGYLTDVEKQVITMMAETLVANAQKTAAVSNAKAIVKGEMKRGSITLAEATDLLKKAGMTDTEIQAFLEGEVKVHEVSVASLIGMGEYIPISAELLAKKCDEEGVPTDEKALYIPYMVAREISSEMDAVKTELLTDFENGLVNDADFKDSLDALATMNGQVKTQLGVDWIIWSPLERSFYYMLAQMRRARKNKQSFGGASWG